MNRMPPEPQLQPVFSPEQIAEAVKKIAAHLSADYAGKQLHLLIVLKGAFVFAADLVRHLELPVTMDFIRVASYHGTQSSGTVNLVLAHETSLRDKDVLIVEDILDTGLSLHYLMSTLAEQQPRSLKSCVLINKTVPRAIDREPDYHGFTWAGGFLAGYGLDNNELLRNLPGIHELS